MIPLRAGMTVVLRWKTTHFLRSGWVEAAVRQGGQPQRLSPIAWDTTSFFFFFFYLFSHHFFFFFVLVVFFYFLFFFFLFAVNFPLGFFFLLEGRSQRREKGGDVRAFVASGGRGKVGGVGECLRRRRRRGRILDNWKKKGRNKEVDIKKQR